MKNDDILALLQIAVELRSAIMNANYPVRTYTLNMERACAHLELWIAEVKV